MNKLLLAATCAAFAYLSPVLAEENSSVPRDGSSADIQQPDAALSPTQLPAVEVTASREPSYTARESSAATKLPMSLKDTPQSVTVITRERMEDQHMESLRDVLDNTTGVYSYSWDSERVSFTSRGFVIDNLMYDGVQTSTSVDTSSIDDTLDTALYDRIEIVRGATGLMTGAGSPSAAVNLVRKHADGKTFIGEAGLSAGSWNTYRGDVDLSQRLNADGSVRGRIVGAYQYNQSYQDLYSRRKPVLYAIVDADLTPHTLLSVGYDCQETRAKGNTWGSFPMFFSDGTRTDWSTSVTTAADWTHWNRRTQSVFGELKHEFDNGWSLRSTLTHRWKVGDYKLLYFAGSPDRTTGLGLGGADGDGNGAPDLAYGYAGNETDRLNVLDLYANGPFNLLGRKHELVAGISGSRLSQSTINYSPVTGGMATPGDFYQWDGSYPEPVFDPTPVDVSSKVTTQRSAYSAVRLSLADPLKLIGGVRYTDWKSEGRGIKSAHPFIPYAGLVGDVGAGLSVFTSYAEIFSPQGGREVSGDYLDPIEGRSIEVGIKGSHLNGRLTTSLTLFDTRQDNVAQPDVDSSGVIRKVKNPDGTNSATDASIGVDGTRTRGFELDASGQIARNWNMALGWSHYNLQGPGGTSINTHIPRTMVRVFSTWSPTGDWSNLTIGGGFNWQSASYTAPYNAAIAGKERVDQRSVLLLNLMTRYEFTSRLSAQLNGNNLLNRKYYVLDNYDNTSYGAPASVTASLNLRF